MRDALNEDHFKAKPTVSEVVSRYIRQTKLILPEMTYGRIFADKITELSGDSVELDEIEDTLVELKKVGVISGRRMISLLVRHRREIGS